MGVGLAIDQHPRAAVVENHVAVIFLAIPHDIAGEKPDSLRLEDRKRLRRRRRLGEVALGMEAQRSQVDVCGVLLPIDHRRAMLG